MFYKKSLFFFKLILSITVCTAQHIVYEGEDTKQPTENRRQPKVTNKCSEGEFLYPHLSSGDNKTEWVCDCKPSFVYYPATEKCYSPYTQGPCPPGEILTLSHKSSIPKCERNSCEFGKVRFEWQCGTLNGEEGCRSYYILLGRKVSLVVDPTSLQLTCSDEDNQFKCANNCCKTSSGLQYGKCNESEQQ